MKPLHQLQNKYGKLTVLSEYTEDGRRSARVRCSCGRAKDVAVSNLLAGRTSSCGHSSCKQYPRAQKVVGYSPRLPRACTVASLTKAWNRYHHPDPKQRRTMAQLSSLHKVKYNTLCNLFDSIRKCGGLKPYLRALPKE